MAAMSLAIDSRTPNVPADLRLPGLSVVLPCLDEQDNVGPAVAEALAAAGTCASAVEVIVVDDGSRDETRVRAEALTDDDERVRLMVHEDNRGYGAAVRSGIEAARMPWILLTDGDRQFDLAELREFLPLAPGHDLIAGYRIDRKDRLPRRLAGRAWSWLMRRTFGFGVLDVDCAFKLVRTSSVRRLHLSSDGAMVSAEILARGVRDGWQIAEMGVHHRPRTAGEPTGGNLAVIARALRERRALARELRRSERPAGALARGRLVHR
jgi:glycosyltransferase involved in cell wall biosynthesis